MDRIAIVGAGSWGTALSVLLASRGRDSISLYARNATKASYLGEFRENTAYLPGVRIPPVVRITADPGSLADSEVLVLSVPSEAVRETLDLLVPALGPRRGGRLWVNTAKGFDPASRMRLSCVIREKVPSGDRVAVLSGPSHAEEVGRFLPTAIVAASPDPQAAARVQALFMGDTFRVYTNHDLIGVEIAGATKNIYALAAGINAGLGFGDNSTAALMTRSLHEMTRLGEQLGAVRDTFAGLAGLGDLLVTCMSSHSRNRRCGVRLGQGEPLGAILADSDMVVEGIPATRAVWELCREQGIHMPIAHEVYEVLYREKDPRKTVEALMRREARPEGERTAERQKGDG